MSLWEVDDRSCRNMIMVLLYKYMYMPLEQFDHVSSSTMSFNVRDNYLVGKTHLEICAYSLIYYRLTVSTALIHVYDPSEVSCL